MPQPHETQPDPLHNLVEGIALRDPATLSFLYESFAPALFGEIISVIEDLNNAISILQNTFVYGIRHIHQHNPQLRLYTWFHQIARYKMLEVAGNTITGNSLRDDLELTHYADAWRQLSPDEKEALEQSIFKGRRHKEIATGMNLPLEVLQRRVFAALSHFHSLLSRY